jgi:hypothetical protein
MIDRNNQFPNLLSDEGQRRRNAMLPELIVEMRSVHRSRRRRKRVGGAVAVMAFIFGAVLWWTQMPPTPPRQSENTVVKHAPQLLNPPVNVSDGGTIKRVQSDAGITERYRVTSSHHAVIILDDDGLLLTLQQINRPSGLVRSLTRTWLTNPVTDAQLQGEHSEDEPST